MRIALPRTKHVERRTVALRHRILESGLEASTDVDDQVGVRDLPNVTRGELEIVRLGTRRREVDDVRARASDLLGDPGKGVEAGDDRRRFRLLIRGAATPRRSDGDGECNDPDEDRTHARTVARL